MAGAFINYAIRFLRDEKKFLAEIYADLDL